MIVSRWNSPINTFLSNIRFIDIQLFDLIRREIHDKKIFYMVCANDFA